MELLQVSRSLIWRIAVSYCHSGPIELRHVSLYLPLLLDISNCLSKFLGFAACLLLSSMLSGCLSLSLRSRGVATCLSLPTKVAGCLLISLCFNKVTAYLILSFIVSGCLSLSLPVQWSCCMFLTVSHGFLLSLIVPLIWWSCRMSLNVSRCCWLFSTVSLSAMELRYVSHRLPLLLAFSNCLCGRTTCLSLSLIVAGSLIVSPSAKELLHISNCLPRLLSFSHCLSGPMEFLHVSNCLSCLLAVSHCLSGPMELLHVPHRLP